MNSNTTLDRFKSSEETMAGIVSHRSSGTPNAPTPSDSSMRRNARVSCFDVSVMPTVRKRELHAFSVHFSVSTSKWIATLARPCEGQKIRFDEKRRCTSFSFSREREARRFAKVYTPPKMMTEATKCVCCSVPFNDKFFHCRNCGAQVCNTCSTRWGIRMIPKTYVTNPNASLTVRVCKSCNWLSNAFCMALLQGNYEQAMSIHGTGNVNLRTSFADIKKEAMFPVHCAVMGGNLELFKWLVEVQGCPLSVRVDKKSGMLLSLQTSSSRTLIDLAMTGKPKIDILSYLVKNNLSVLDTKDPRLAPETLQTLLGAGFRFEMKDPELDVESSHMDSTDLSLSTLEDACVICCERQMDCVLTPCGHQVCCSDCGNKMKACPVCKKACSVLRIYRL